MIRGNPNSRAAIANGFELIAAAMEPCFDCGCPELDDVIDPEDSPKAREWSKARENLNNVVNLPVRDTPEAGA